MKFAVAFNSSVGAQENETYAETSGASPCTPVTPSSLEDTLGTCVVRLCARMCHDLADTVS